MIDRRILVLTLAGLLVLAGCASSSSPTPSSAQEVKSFKGNPSSPDLQHALQAHAPTGAPPAPTAAGG